MKIHATLPNGARAALNSDAMQSQGNILIVDDDPEIRRLLVDYLARNGLAALAARDGREMWQTLARHAIDLVVLDLMLPGDDGLTLCRDLRAQSTFRS